MTVDCQNQRIAMVGDNLNTLPLSRTLQTQNSQNGKTADTHARKVFHTPNNFKQGGKTMAGELNR